MTAPSHSRPATFWRAFITVFILVFTVSAAITFLAPEKYAGICRMRVEMDETYMFSPTGKTPDNLWLYDPFFVKPTFEILRSPSLLTNVVAKLDLNVRWGKRYNGGGAWPTWESLAMLQRNLELGVVPQTQLITITYYSVDKYEAAEIANAVAEAYADYRVNMRENETLNIINILLDDAATNAARIQAASTNLNHLRDKLKVRDDDPNSIDTVSAFNVDQLQTYNRKIIEQQRICKSLDDQIKQLRPLNPNKLPWALEAVTKDQVLTNLLGQLNALEQTLVNLTNNHAPGDVEIKRTQSMIQLLNQQIDARVAGIMQGLETELKAKRAGLEALKAAVEQAKQADQEEQVRDRPYWDERRNLAQLVEFQRILIAKIEQEKVNNHIPPTTLVQITDYAQPQDDPVKPNKPLCLVEGGFAALLLGALSGWVAVWRDRRGA